MTKSAAMVLVGLVFSLNTSFASGAFDFTYAIDVVTSIPSPTGGVNLTVTLDNAMVVSEAAAFYQPMDSGGANASITYKFTFPQATNEAELFANLAFFNWWYGRGSGALYGSNNGTGWTQLLLSSYPPSQQALYPAYDDALPGAVLGTNELWI